MGLDGPSFIEPNTKKPHGLKMKSENCKVEEPEPKVSKIFHALKSGLRWIWEDIRKPELIWVKVIFLFQSASLVTLYPYLTVHMRSLGFSIEDTAIVNGVVPLADIFGPPAAGLLADKMGNFRVFMGVVALLHGASSLLLLAVPEVKMGIECGEIIAGTLPNPTANFTLQPSTDCHTSDDDGWNSAFPAYLCARILLDIFRATSLTLFEGAVVAIIKEHGGDYGLQKLFGTLGAIVFGPLTGMMMDKSATSTDSSDGYAAMFYLFFALRLVGTGLILKLGLEFKPPAKKVFRELCPVLFRMKVVSYLCAFSVAGGLWGFMETFLFWHLEDMESSKVLMGTSLSVGTLAGVPVSVFSSLILRVIGHDGIVVFAFLLYSVRFAGYAFVRTPEASLVLELFKPFSTTLLLISAFTFIKEVSPMTTAATVEAIFGSLHFGVGRGLGAMAGAYLLKFLGARLAFQVFSVISLASAIVYWAAMLSQRARSSNKFSVAKAEGTA